MAVTRMDFLLCGNAAFDQAAAFRADPHLESTDSDKNTDGKKDGKTGGRQSGGFFGTVVGEILFRRNSEKRPGILSISHPSDGHPQEELTPDFGWFRALTFNNATWTLYWPELTV